MQSEAVQNPLTPADWQKLENLQDLLSETALLPKRLQKALAYLVETLGYSRAAMLVRSGKDNEPYFWIQNNLPLHWQNLFDDPYSPLNRAGREIIQKGQILQADKEFEIAAGFPVTSNGICLGAVLVFGPELPVEAQERWTVYLRAVGRALAMWKASQVYPELGEELLALEGILSTLKENRNDIHALQRTALIQLRDLFEAEDVILILFDENNPDLAFQKQLGLDENLAERRVLIPNNSLIQRARKDIACLEGDLCNSPELAMWLGASMDTMVSQVVCSALQSHDNLLGAVVIINPGQDPKLPTLRTLLRVTADVLANAMDSTREITSLKISMADLEANRWEIINSRNTLRSMFDSIPSSVYILDRSYTLIAVNLRRSERAGKRPNFLVGKKCYEQLFNRIDPCPSCRVLETMNSGSITNRNSREWIDQEHFIEWEITSFPIQEKNNLPHAIIIFEEDVTEKRNLEANLIQSEKLAAVGQLAASVAHEINNPLAAIIANAQILKRQVIKAGGDLDTVDALTLIETAGVRAAQVVSNLLGIARKEKKYEFELISLNDTLRSASTLVVHEVTKRSIQVVMDLDESIPEIMASKNHLQGVWINMLVNSIDAIDDKPNGLITLSTRYENDEFIIVITDNGKGIPQDQLARIFEPFFTTKVAGKGTGLGLSVSQRVIREHRGTIIVESELEKGSRFTVTLPDLVKKKL